ncbi:MAG TPA: NAD-dependent epimerase/dehydratase family protein [Pyrinomonadaceae bacterium]|nr:NAD-dependent epimerase/dehydratase family protein [Pyrinomonadaceae bacterium]
MSAPPDIKRESERAPVVVLGGLGFMGSHISRALVRRGERVRIFDRLYASHALVADIESQVEIVEGDINRPGDVIEAVNDAGTVIHLVHTTVPGSSMADPAFDITSNVAASAAWLTRLSETNVRRILYFSSGGTVYGVPREPLIDEGHPTDPISSYGITKLAIEKYVAMYGALSGVEHRILRPSNVYGEGQRLHIGQGVIGILADRALRGEPVEIWGTGESLRDYLHVEDLVAATLALVDYDGPERVFNVSSGRGHSVLDIVRVVGEQLGIKPEIVFQPARGFDVPVNVLDPARLNAATGWRAAVGLGEGVARTIDWIKGLHKHEAGGDVI